MHHGSVRNSAISRAPDERPPQPWTILKTSVHGAAAPRFPLPARHRADRPRGCRGVFAGSPACVGAVSEVVPVDLVIPGCPPTPTQLLQGLLALLSGR